MTDATHTHSTISTPLGELCVTFSAQQLLSLQMGRFRPAARRIKANSPRNELLDQVVQQLESYFNDAAFCFQLPLLQQGTAFQQRVWQALRQIPAGEVRTYGELAHRVDSHPRAIGMACRHNPFPILVPCHRVVAANGWGGFDGKRQGERLALKRWLLEHEGITRR